MNFLFISGDRGSGLQFMVISIFVSTFWIIKCYVWRCCLFSQPLKNLFGIPLIYIYWDDIIFLLPTGVPEIYSSHHVLNCFFHFDLHLIYRSWLFSSVDFTTTNHLPFSAHNIYENWSLISNIVNTIARDWREGRRPTHC